MKEFGVWVIEVIKGVLIVTGTVSLLLLGLFFLALLMMALFGPFLLIFRWISSIL